MKGKRLRKKESKNEPTTLVQYLIHSFQVGVRNQQNLQPRIPTTDVAKLLQYSGSRVEHRDEFSL